MIMRHIFILLVSVFFFYSCQEESQTPKPRAYPKINFPEKDYQSFDIDFCEFSFEYPKYCLIQQDTAFFDEKPLHPCWFDVYYPDFDSRIHFSYYPVGEYKSLEKLKTDAFEMADWHNKKANYIEEIKIEKPNRVYGFAFDIEGPVASPFQFYITDSTNHFLRGSLYFNTQAKPDSLAPVYDFVKHDIINMIESFGWKDSE